MTKPTAQKAAFVFTKEESGSREAGTMQLAVPIPRQVSRWIRHYALDRGPSQAALILQILRDFIVAYRGPVK
jgi:hypothetical protein